MSDMAGPGPTLKAKPGTTVERQIAFIVTKRGRLEFEIVTGRCVIDGCKVMGGSLFRIQETTDDPDALLDLAWQGKAVTICGEHLKAVLTAVLHLPEEEGS